ncbi:putative class 3 lipase [Trypanosoma conorhini]|uniref:Putative class 3 lipase n=1 Tax=Trypanosoma conorhini TaxID=83891 RepID=A0A3R7LL08_9TRYP|nr:putative class 3 lipase [Trypanosoma conorhini]RNF26774.1 putative class 3 lipase [Trypanosoma conorhini]
MAQPQWERNILVREYHYTHTQPQWSDGSPVVSRFPLALARTCASCKQRKEACKCRVCFNCQKNMLVRRHHCRKCWQAVCQECRERQRYVHMLGEPMKVCNRCALPRGILILSRAKGHEHLWGLYVLQRATEMPNVCITPSCRTPTYHRACPECGLPTITTRLHEERVIRVDARASVRVSDSVKYLEVREFVLRCATVDKYAAEEVERSFRLWFPRFQEVFAFPKLNSAVEAQHLLLSVVASAAAYEYDSCPNLFMSHSDLPYSRLLKLLRSTSRYSVFEAPGKIKFISFPGTHNYRTFAVNMRCGRIRRQVWSRLIDGLTASSGANGEYQRVCGGVHLVWEASLHQGFAREADEAALPIEQLVKDVRQNGYRLVLSGHSLGGAVAQLVAIRMLREYPGVFKDNLKCVSIGAPLVGNYQLAQCVERCGWLSNFHHLVYRSDIVPRLLCVDQMTRDFADQFIKGLLELPSSLRRWLKPTSDAKAAPLKDLDTIDAEIKKGEDPVEVERTPLPTTDHRAHRMYACFGRYHFLNHGGLRYFSTDDSEVAFHHLKDGCGSDNNLLDHSLASYNRAIFLQLHFS